MGAVVILVERLQRRIIRFRYRCPLVLELEAYYFLGLAVYGCSVPLLPSIIRLTLGNFVRRERLLQPSFVEAGIMRARAVGRTTVRSTLKPSPPGFVPSSSRDTK